MVSGALLLLAMVAIVALLLHANVITMMQTTAGNTVVPAGSKAANSGLYFVAGGGQDVTVASPITELPLAFVARPFATHLSDPVAPREQNDLTIAHNVAAGSMPAQDFTGPDARPLTCVPHCYSSSSSAQPTATLTLDDRTGSNAQLVFRLSNMIPTPNDSSALISDDDSMRERIVLALAADTLRRTITRINVLELQKAVARAITDYNLIRLFHLAKHARLQSPGNAFPHTLNDLRPNEH